VADAPVSARSAAGVKLFSLGFLTLFLELALIRYLAGNIWNLGYVPNLVLIDLRPRGVSKRNGHPGRSARSGRSDASGAGPAPRPSSRPVALAPPEGPQQNEPRETANQKGQPTGLGNER
jgi:hypothetical protein